jgi:hypothetical protein
VLSVATALTSWKEIAAYLHKGVRTAQRWEQELGLPVRRPKTDGEGIVFALPEELDAWLRTRPHSKSDDAAAQLKQLSDMVAKLQAENARLRQQGRGLTDEPVQSVEDTKAAQVADSLLRQCSRLVSASGDSVMDCAESIETARNIRMLRSLQNHSLGYRPLFQQQISVMLTCCALAEDDLLYGRIEAARRLIQKQRKICEALQSWLSEAHAPDSRTLPVQEQLTELHARMMSIESRFIT